MHTNINTVQCVPGIRMVLKKQKLEIIPSAIHFVLLGTEIMFWVQKHSKNVFKTIDI